MKQHIIGVLSVTFKNTNSFLYGSDSLPANIAKYFTLLRVVSSIIKNKFSFLKTVLTLSNAFKSINFASRLQVDSRPGKRLNS